MQRARRLGSVVALATVGILAVAGCRPQSGVAAYVGDREITEDRVTAIVDDLQQKVDEQFHAQPPNRTEVVRTLILGNLCELASAEKGYQPQREVTAEMVAQAFGMPADVEYVQHRAAFETCRSGLTATPAEPDPDELAELVERGKSTGFIRADTTVADLMAQNGDQLGWAFAERRALTEAADAYGLTVSPRYRPLEIALLSFPDNSAAVGMPLGEPASDAVVDAR